MADAGARPLDRQASAQLSAALVPPTQPGSRVPAEARAACAAKIQGPKAARGCTRILPPLAQGQRDETPAPGAALLPDASAEILLQLQEGGALWTGGAEESSAERGHGREDCRAGSAVVRAMLNEPICECHWSRMRIRRPAFRLGLCRDCFRGKPIGRDEEVRRVNPRLRRCAIQGCPRQINRRNSSGICSFHQRNGFVSDERQKKAAAAHRRWYARNKDKVAAATRRWQQANKDKVAAAHRRSVGAI